MSSSPPNRVELPSPWDARWRQWYRRALPAYWLTLFLLMHFPGARLEGPVPHPDWIAHTCAYALLTFLLWRFAETFHYPLSPAFPYLVSPFLAAYAALDEYLQGFVQRTPSVADWLADTIGIHVALVVLTVLAARARRRRVASGAAAP